MPGEAPKIGFQDTVMPTVPNVRPIEEQMPLTAAGGGPVVEEENKTREATLLNVGAIAAHEMKKANQIAVAKNTMNLNDVFAKHLYGDEQNPGYLNMTGQEAIDQSNKVVEKFKADADKLSEGLVNDDQRRMFEHQVVSTTDRMNEVVHNHIFKQREILDSQASTGLLSSCVQTGAKAVGNEGEDRVIKDAKQQGLDYIAAHQALRNPLEFAGGEYKESDSTKSQKLKFTTEFHTQILDQMIKDPSRADDAMKYYQQAFDSGEINVDKDKTLFNMLKKNQSIQDADKMADEIYRGNINDKKAALARVEKIEDVEFKKAVFSDLNRRFRDNSEQRKATESSVKQGLLQSIDKTGQMPDVGMLNGLKDSDQKEIQRYWERKHYDIPTDLKRSTYFGLMDLATSSDEKEQADFIHENLSDPYYRNRVSDSDLKQLTGKQAKMRTENSGWQGDSWHPQTQAANETLRQLGIDPSDNKNPTVLAMKQELDSYAKGYQGVAGKSPNSDDFRKMAKVVATKMVLENSGQNATYLRSWSNTIMTPADRVFFESVADKAKLPKTDASILRLYDAYRLKELNAQ